VDLAISDGEFCVLAGPSRAGKTTLLRLIAGLEWLDAGSIEIDGESVDDWRPGQRNVSMVFHENALIPRISAYNNLAFSLRTRGVRPEEIEARVRRIADLLGITDLLQRPTGELSKPAQRRPRSRGPSSLRQDFASSTSRSPTPVLRIAISCAKRSGCCTANSP
jgi:ABC-type sugar transport system ATPase subunit